MLEAKHSLVVGDFWSPYGRSRLERLGARGYQARTVRIYLEPGECRVVLRAQPFRPKEAVNLAPVSQPDADLS